MEKLKTNKVSRWIFVLVAITLTVALAVGILLSMRLRTPELSVICGVDTSNLLLQDAQELIADKVDDYMLHLTVGDQSFDITAEDIGLTFLSDNFKSVVEAMVDYDTMVDPWTVLSIDRNKLTSFLENNFDQKRTKAVPATVVWDDADGCFKIVNGSPEHWCDVSMLADLVTDGIGSLTTEIEILEQQLYKEFVDAEERELTEAMVQKANDLIQLEFEYVFSPRKVELGNCIIDGSMIASFLRFDSETHTIYLDDDAIMTYVNGISSEYTYLMHKDRFVTHDGDRIDIKVPFQEQIVDVQRFCDLIADNILNGTAGRYEVPYSGAVNFDGSYVEVSIPQQHLWVYIDGIMVLESDVVTGNESIGKLTPTGINYVGGHLRDIKLFGDYFVNYWMAITRDGIYGFHDADGWRSPEEYGGDTYKTHGSGGCVNMPREKISIMYDLVPYGTPIVIYNAYFYD